MLFFGGGDGEGCAERHLSHKLPGGVYAPMGSYGGVDKGIIVLQGCAETHLCKCCPDCKLQHCRGLRGVAIKLVGIGGKLLFHGVNNAHILIEEQRSAACGKATINLFSAFCKFVGWYNLLKALFDNAPEADMVQPEEQHYPT